jgi:hypothetical protein
MLTNERTFGQVGFIKNGGSLDIWIRIDGRPRWFSVSRAELAAFLASDDKETILSAESNGNSEASFEDDVAALRAADASLP